MASRIRPRGLGRRLARVPAADALRSPAFRRLWLVAMTGTFAMGAAFTALGWVIVEESGSPLLVSLVVVSFLAPQLVAGPVGGVLADRYGRGGLLRMGMAARASTMALTGVSLLAFPHALLPLYALNVAGSIASGATIPSRRALMADIVPPGRLGNAVALDEFAVTSMFIIGPIAAGAVLVAVAPGVVFGIIAIVVALGAVLVPRAPRAAGPADEHRGRKSESFFRSMAEGLLYVRRSRVLLGVTAIAFTTETLAFNYLSLVPVFASDVFGGGSRLLGALNGTMPAGELIGAALMAALAARILRPGRLLLAAALGAHAVAIPLAASGALPLTFALLAGLGVCGNIFIVTASTLILRETPPEARARVLGLQQLTWGAGAAGGLAAGALATVFSPQVGVIIPAAMGVALVAAIAALSPELRRGRTAPAAVSQEAAREPRAG